MAVPPELTTMLQKLTTITAIFDEGVIIGFWALGLEVARRRPRSYEARAASLCFFPRPCTASRFLSTSRDEAVHLRCSLSMAFLATRLRLESRLNDLGHNTIHTLAVSQDSRIRYTRKTITFDKCGVWSVSLAHRV